MISIPKIIISPRLIVYKSADRFFVFLKISKLSQNHLDFPKKMEKINKICPLNVGK